MRCICFGYWESASSHAYAFDVFDDDGGVNVYPTMSSQAGTVVKETIVYIQQNYHERVSRSELASAVGVSESYLTQIFRRFTGIALWDYLARYRVHRAKVLLRRTNDSIAEISAQVGFDDPAYFSRVFRRYVGQSPRDFRNTSGNLRREMT
jgi:AraC-like DNA-binding protein